MRQGILPLLALVLSGGLCAAGAPLARPTPQQAAYQDMELQMFVCLDPCTWQNREYDNHSTPLSRINPDKLDAEQWCRAARSFGAGQILFVAKHTGGFCWWQTQTSKYGIKETPYKGGQGDVLGEVAVACRKHGLKLGIYVYPGDDQWGAMMGGGGKTRDPAKQEAYNRVFRQQMTEVLSNYGPVHEVWFDGSCIIEVGDILRKHCPDAMVFQGPHATLRWVGNEAGYAPYPAWNSVRKKDAASGVATAAHGTPDGDVWMPLEVDTVLHDHFWFWKKDNARARRSVDTLMDCYYKSVGRGAVLLLNSCPGPDGLIPEGDLAVYEAFGKEIQRRFGRPIAQTAGQGEVVELDLGKPTPVNHVITMEDITQGERVRAYRLEGLAGQQWKTLFAGGISIGHKKIDLFPRQTLSKVRLVVTRSADRPIIRRLAAFDVSGVATGRAITDAAWTLDDGAGEVARADGADWPGKVLGPTWAKGHAGTCLDFRTPSDQVNLGNAAWGESDFTLAAWIFPRSIPKGQARIIAKERIGVATNQFRLYVHEGGRLGFAITDASGRGPAYPFATPARQRADERLDARSRDAPGADDRAVRQRQGGGPHADGRADRTQQRRGPADRRLFRPARQRGRLRLRRPDRRRAAVHAGPVGRGARRARQPARAGLENPAGLGRGHPGRRAPSRERLQDVDHRPDAGHPGTG